MNRPPRGNEYRSLNCHLKMFEVTQQPVPNMTVQIKAGSFWSNGTKVVEFPGGISSPITKPPAGAKWVIVGITNKAVIKIFEGAPAPNNPVVPTVSKNTLPCAAIYVQANTSTITDEMIYDLRPVFYAGTHETDHEELGNREAPECHPISAITGLTAALSSKPSTNDLAPQFAAKADKDGTTAETFTFNKDQTGTPVQDVVLAFERGNLPNAMFRWNEEDDIFDFSVDGGTTWTVLNSGGSGGGSVDAYTKAETDDLLEGKSDADHNHDEVYATKEHEHDYSEVYAAKEHEHDYSEVYAAKEHSHEISEIDGLEDIDNVISDLSNSLLPFKNVLYVATNGDDTDGTGSQGKPFATIEKAVASIDPAVKAAIVLGPGTFVGYDLPAYVAIFGQGTGSTFISGSWTAVRSQVIENIALSGGTLTLRGSTSITNLYSSGNIIVDIPNAATGIQAFNIDVVSTSGVPITINSCKEFLFNGGLCKSNDSSSAVVHNSGTLILTNMKASADSANPTVNSTDGTVNLNFSQITNTGTGKALSISNGANASNPNVLFGLMGIGVIDTGSSPVIVEGVHGLTLESAVNGANIVYRSSSALKNDSTVSGDTVSEALSALAPKSGSTRPVVTAVGTQFFDTNLSPARPIWWNGTEWVDHTGTAV